MISGMDYELREMLLLRCLRARKGGTEKMPLAGIAADRWDELVEQAGRHGVKALLYKRLQETADVGDIPCAAFQRLHEAYLRSASHNIRLFRELGSLLTSLGEQGIQVVVLKGGHLAELVYRNLALRPMWDLDLLVRAADLGRVQNRLRQLGYGSSWRSGEGRACVDVHWTIACPDTRFSIDIDELWSRAQPATIAGVPTLILALEDIVLHLCLHAGYHHAFALGLRPLCDIAETLFRHLDAVDWEAVVGRARSWGVQRCVYLGLRLSHELLDAPVPKEILESLEPEDVGRWAKRIEQQVFRGNDSTYRTVPESNYLPQLWSRRPLRDKAACVLRRVFPSRKELACLYCIPPDSPRIWLYYLVRFKDLVQRYGPVIWRAARRDRQTMATLERDIDTAGLRDWMATTVSFRL